jgi:CRP-like cAMP-binding protein
MWVYENEECARLMTYGKSVYIVVKLNENYSSIFAGNEQAEPELNMKEIAELSNKTITINRNEYLKVKGSIDTNIYFISSGSLRIFVSDEFEEQIIRFGYPGNLVVSLDSFLTGKPSVFFIQAIKKTVLKVITKQQFNEFLQIESNIILWTNILESLVIQQLEREIDILTSSPKERYMRVLRRSPQLFQEIPNRYIANYLRMSPETLSRLKKS